MDKYINNSLAAGIIRPSSSPAGAGFFFVAKKDKTLRPCNDNRLRSTSRVKGLAIQQGPPPEDGKKKAGPMVLQAIQSGESSLRRLCGSSSHAPCMFIPSSMCPRSNQFWRLPWSTLRFLLLPLVSSTGVQPTRSATSYGPVGVVEGYNTWWTGRPTVRRRGPGSQRETY